MWILVVIGGRFYIQQRRSPSAAGNALLPAAMLAAGLYLMTGFPAVVDRLRRLSRETAAVLLVAAAAAPYLVFSLGAHTYQTSSLLVLLALAGAAAYWWLVFPRGVIADLLFLAFVAAVSLAKPFTLIYAMPVAADSLGRLMWISTAMLAALLVGRVEDPRAGFWPSAWEWRIGFVTFACFLPVAVALGLQLHFASFHPVPGLAWKAVPLFLGMLWGVAYGEEFIFRGLLQRWLSGWLRNTTAGLVAASILFGSVHLFFRQFPNWKFAILAAVAGLFYGWAFQRTGGVRAPMVAHALVNVVWRLLFS
ncbi:MAG: CPBP family intramembrane metalloprotease [Acidobacteria bacterium]|nr:CPBP family intramembrane metalloprotease [Acidobacteriota bacterium]